MKANEIRIGNWVDFNGEKARISQLWEMEAIFKCGDSALYSELKPIPLTEEILLKAGFKKDVNGILWFQITPDRHFELIHSQGYYYPQLAQSPEMSCDNISVVSLNRIESVHQLQNLFFALTGEDIKIEL